MQFSRVLDVSIDLLSETNSFKKRRKETQTMPKSRNTSKSKPVAPAAEANVTVAKAEKEASPPPAVRQAISDEDAVKNLEEVAGILTTMDEQLDRLHTIIKPTLEPLDAAVAASTSDAGEELLSSLTAYEQHMLGIGLTLAKAARLSGQRKRIRWLARDFRRLSNLSMKRRNTEFMAEQFRDAIIQQLAREF